MSNENLEKLEQIATGLETKLEMKKNELAKAKNVLKDLNISTDMAMNELNRLKTVGENLASSLNEKKQQVEEKESQVTMNNLLSELSKVL